jgi:hypothetical protein
LVTPSTLFVNHHVVVSNPTDGSNKFNQFKGFVEFPWSLRRTGG